MKYHAICAAAAAIHLSATVLADITVTDVTARQRYPWNGLVDIICSVKGIDGQTNGLKLAVAAVMPDTGRASKVSHFRVDRGGEWSDDREVRTNGNYRLLWDAAADLGPVRFTNMVVRVTIDARARVQLWEGGPYWATTNIGAEEPHEYGLYFWWGDTVGYRREGSAWVASDGSSSKFSFGSKNTPTYNKSPSTLQSEGWVVLKDDTYVLAPEHDAAQVQWGNGWRMPTYWELRYLINNCDWTPATMNGVNGCVVQGRGDYADASIFLPAAGYGYGNGRNYAGSSGYYWAPVTDSTDTKDSWYLAFSSKSGGVMMYSYGDRYDGYTVRPVQGFAE